MMSDQTRARQSAGRTPGPAGRRSPSPEPLLPSGEQDKIVRRLRQALNAFADTPFEALEEAESAYDEATAQLLNALADDGVSCTPTGRARTPTHGPTNFGTR